MDNISELQEENVYRKKQVIYTEGNHPHKLFFVKQGKVKTYITNEDGKTLITGLFGEGDFFGYTALLEGTVYKDSAEAFVESTVVDIPATDFTDLLYHDPATTRKIVQMLSRNISEKEEQLLNIAYNSLRKRVATALVSLQKKYSKQENPHFEISFSREDLANIAGTAKESLIRTLSEFKAEKLIDIQDGKIILLNESKLANLLN